MNLNILPVGNAPQAVKTPWFPTHFQAVIFRNWNIVSADRIAAALDSSADDVRKHAEKMGLPPENADPAWLARGYVSIIRTNWQLLNYDAMLRLLGWSAEKLADILQNEDFLWIKLGSLKPQCPVESCRELTADEEKQTAIIKQTVLKYQADYPVEAPFEFIKKFQPPAEIPAFKTADGLFIAYSYSALYGDSLANPELDPYPEGLLYALRQKGVNAIWLPGILYQLHYWADAPEMSVNYEKRIASLNDLVRKAAKYGMKVFLYLNEPRGLPIGLFKNNQKMQEKYLEVEDIEQNLFSMCTAKSAVKEYLANAVKSLFASVKGLGGAFMITQSEYLTHCHSRCINGEQTSCPRCAERPVPEVIAEVATIISNAARSENPDAQIICWDWAWKKEWIPEIAAKLPQGTAFMAVSESQIPIEIDGVKTYVQDYSISRPGPGEKSKKTWQIAAEYGLETFAKTQLSCSWEGSAVPYIPATKLVEQHLQGLRKEGIKNYVTNWTLGGYPSFNMDLLQMTHDEMVKNNFGENVYDQINEALTLFSEAFRNFPFNLEVLYNSPHNIGPANLLYPEQTNYKATMVGIPYDDLKGWCGPYRPETYYNSLYKLCEIWQHGLDALKSANSAVKPEYRTNYNDLCSVADACYCAYASAANQAFFIDRLRGGNDEIAKQKLLANEINLAARLLKLARQDSRLGFEATNHYAYTLNELLEKIINCENLMQF